MSRLARPLARIKSRLTHSSKPLRPSFYALNQWRFATNDGNKPESERFDIKIENFETAKRAPNTTDATNAANTNETTEASTNATDTTNTTNMESTERNEMSNEERILNAEKEQAAMKEQLLMNANNRSTNEDSSDNYGNAQFDTTYIFGMKRNTFRSMILAFSCAVGAGLYYNLRPSPISDATNRRNMHFFARLNADPNITVTYSGLMYRVLDDGKKQKNSNTTKTTDGGSVRDVATPDLDHHCVRIHYQGRMMDGRVFDSSFDGEPCIFAAKSLIKGLHQGIGKMTRGTTAEFFIPPHLAYGEKGSKFIPAHEPLIFKVKLLDFWKDQDISRKDERKVLAL